MMCDYTLSQVMAAGVMLCIIRLNNSAASTGEQRYTKPDLVSNRHMSTMMCELASSMPSMTAAVIAAILTCLNTTLGFGVHGTPYYFHAVCHHGIQKMMFHFLA